jgi:prepilin-type N-terminal cleavage/methylation domain-containing protein
MILRNQNTDGAVGTLLLRRLRVTRAGFTLLEVSIAGAILAVGFLGAFATILQTGKMVSASEEEALVMSGLEQRLDQLRLLEWPVLTDGTGITSAVWTARPAATAGIVVSQETFAISPCDVPGAYSLNAVWDGAFAPVIGFSAGTPLAEAGAVKAVATITWTAQRTNRQFTRSLITVISRGGISRSDRP